MSTNGGKRAGAGRKKGASSIRTQEIATAFLATDAMTPLEVILKCMSDHVDLGEFIEAFPYAVAAAPYLHAKLASSTAKQDKIPTYTIINEFIGMDGH